MVGVYEVIYDEFADELDVLVALLDAFRQPTSASAKTRIAAANSATLLLSATFEEYVRELAREFAKETVYNATKIDDLPKKFLNAVWRRNLEALAKAEVADDDGTLESANELYHRFMSVYEFRRGDLSKDIYTDLIKNQNNMTIDEINGLFSISGKKNIAKSCCENAEFVPLLGDDVGGREIEALRSKVDDYFKRRNKIAHSLALNKSLAPDLIRRDIEFLKNFGRALSQAV